MSSLILILLLMFSSPSFGKNYMTLLGGGGEPKGSGTIFDHEMKNVTRFLTSASWESKVAFNGGHSSTEKILSPLKKKTTVEPFTSLAYEKAINDYIVKIKSGKIKKNDQLIVYISSHGAVTKKGEKSHSISTSGKQIIDFDNLQGSTLVSLDKLQELTHLANQKGIKLGIIDMSCHSGSTLALANKNTCVITSTGPNHFAWAGNNTTFSSQFAKNMAKGRSLEDVFLRANTQKKDVSFPMISSEAGVKIQDMIYKEISPYLYDARNVNTTKKMLSYYDAQYADNQCSIIDDNYLKLKKFVNSMNTIVSASEVYELRVHIDKYYKLQKKIREKIDIKNSKPFNEITKLCSKDGKECSSYTLYNLLQMETLSSMTMLENKIKTDKNKSKDYTRKLEVIRAANNYKLKHIKLHPEHANIFKTVSEITLKEESTHLSRSISQELQGIYSKIYHRIKKSQYGPNPCASIKL